MRCCLMSPPKGGNLLSLSESATFLLAALSISVGKWAWQQKRKGASLLQVLFAERLLLALLLLSPHCLPEVHSEKRLGLCDALCIN